MSTSRNQSSSITVESDENGSDKKNVWSIRNLNEAIRSKLEGSSNLQNIWIEGEIFNVTYHSSGHIYFSLKDDSSVVRCTFFKNANFRFKDIKLTNGMKILAGGGISVYVPRGDYQFNVSRVMPSGQGELRIRIEELKKRLYGEGLFNPERKKELPFLPLTLGVATAPTGAAIKDIIRVARNRFPRINILLAPCLVQGEGAIDSIVTAIRALNDPELGVDVIIAGRGGGSFEDLMAFNEEPVVRAFADSRIPIVSAVGHEIDHPLSDLSADVYAPTPSAAVEMVLPEYEELVDRLEDLEYRIRAGLKNRYKVEKDRLYSLLKSKVHTNPASSLEVPAQRVDLATRELRNSALNLLRDAKNSMQEYRILPVHFRNLVATKTNRFQVLSERLGSFSPLATLKRGFSVVRDDQKTVIRSVSQVQQGQNLEVILDQGRMNVEVVEVFPGKEDHPTGSRGDGNQA